MRHRAKAGFTLVELLVVIGIIALLASLLVAAISGAMKKAKRITCTNHLRQINMGVRMYSDDANDKSPGKVAGVKFVMTGYKELMKNSPGMANRAIL